MLLQRSGLFTYWINQIREEQLESFSIFFFRVGVENLFNEIPLNRVIEGLVNS